MRIEENGQGYLRSNLSGDLVFKSFVPASLSSVLPMELDPDSVNLLGTCSRKIGELEGMLRFVPNAGMYLAMYVRKEALLSAQIEGTQCTFDDILDPENADLAKKDIADVVAYVRATEFAVGRMNDLPLCTRLLRETHEKLLEGTRGQEKNPGQIRTSKNWIGPTGCTLREASFIPPNVEDMTEALAEMDIFINTEHDVDPLIKAALIHYQFETIHPFLDGNGRIGRLLITLSLMNDGVLSGAIFYPSYQFKLNRTEYYDMLMDVRKRGTYESWIHFFCKCLLVSAQDAIDSLVQLVQLREQNVSLINERLGRSATNGRRLLELLEEAPFVDISFIMEKLDISRTTAAHLVEEFCNIGILHQVNAEKQRYRVYMYESYLNILRQGSEPIA